MKRISFVLAAAALLCSAALAQPGYGPGMGGGYGPGMMGGYGPGMMGGGYGPGMMGGGYGPGMMGGWGAEGGGIPDLTPDQRKAIAEARQDHWKKQRPLMQQMHALGWSASDEAGDDQAARRNYDAMAGLQKQMFDNSLELRRRIDATLTPKQREEWRRNW